MGAVTKHEFMRIRTITLALFMFVLTPAWGKVLVRWTEPSLPPRKALGTSQVVMDWDSNAGPAIRRVVRQGYDVYVQVSVQEARAAADLLRKLPLAGIILDAANARPGDIDAARKMLQAGRSKLSVLVLDSNGKQPQMRGQTITTRNGILQVSSPTAQPWLDSNLATVRFDEEFHPEQTPLYTFKWEPGDSLQQANGPSAEDYALAIAEAGAIHADLILNVDEKLQKGLAENQPAAWDRWNKVKKYLAFDGTTSRTALRPQANVGVLAGDYDTAYEPMNLMGRHNIPYRVLNIAGITGSKLQGLDVVTVFTAPDQQAVATLMNFAKQGGTVVLVNLKGSYPWQSANPAQTAEHAVSYVVGKGRVIELSEPVSDPETFAQDVRRLVEKDKSLISVWNALTILAIAYRNPRTGEHVIELVNFSEEPLRIQLRLKGSFSAARYETPDQKCCQSLPGIKRGGFTEFVVPSLGISGRLRLRPQQPANTSTP